MTKTKMAPAPRFPALTEERAEEIADVLLMLGGGKDELVILAAELVLGLAPVIETSENITRVDAADAFIRRAFYHTRAFEECGKAFKRRLGDPETRIGLYAARAAEDDEEEEARAEAFFSTGAAEKGETSND